MIPKSFALAGDGHALAGRAARHHVDLIGRAVFVAHVDAEGHTREPCRQHAPRERIDLDQPGRDAPGTLETQRHTSDAGE